MPDTQPPDIDFAGHELNRPECALAHESGIFIVSDWTEPGGVSIVFPDGSVKRHLAVDPPLTLRPNGIALVEGGDLLLAHLGADKGGIWRLRPDGSVDPEIGEIENSPLPPSNFCHVDADGRRWVSVSTRHVPRSRAYRCDIADGFIVLSDERGDRIVADGLGYTNECLVHPDGRRLFVNETFGRRLSCFDITPGGELKNRRTVTTFEAGTFPDGMAFDENGDVWIVSIVSNRVIHVDGEGRKTLLLEDADPEFLEKTETAFLNGEMGRSHLDGNPAARLRNISSLAFAGHDMRTMVFGCLLGQCLPIAASPVAGWVMPHYRVDIAPLIRALVAMPAVQTHG